MARSVSASGACYRLFASIILAAFGIAATQRPERQQELHLPGLGVVLKVGWQMILYRGCRFAVPDTWRATTDETLIHGPDGSSISIGSARFPSWAAHKGQVRAAFGRVDVLHEDSDRRLWLEIADSERTQHYIDVPVAGGACIAILDLPRSTALNAEDTARIVEGIGSAPEHWSPAAK